MSGRAVLGGVAGVLLVGAAAAGVWWQGARAAAKVRQRVVSAVEAELQRDPIDRGSLVQAERELAAVAAKDPAPELSRARARAALALRMPDDALGALDEITFRGQASTPDLELRAQALALRHAVGGRVDDAHDAAARAIEHFEATQSASSAFLAWQCASRIGDDDTSQTIAARLAATAPEAWQNKVVQALLAFDPDKPETGAALRRLQLEVASVPELDIAVAALDLTDADEAVRARGVATVKRVLAEVPASKPARLVAVVAADRQGDVVGRKAHLQWLVANFPRDDRVETWRKMAAQN